MGSGAPGGGGGGGGGGGSGYSIGQASAGSSRLVPRSKEKIDKAFDELMAGPPKEYYMAIFASDLVEHLYGALQDIAVSLCLNQDWQAIQSKYQVSPDPGCLVQLKEAMVRMYGGDQVDPTVRDACLMVLETFFTYAIGNSPTVYAAADAAKVFQKADRKVLVESRSSYFLREMIFEVAKCQKAEQTSELRTNLYKYSLERADRIVRDFEHRFKDLDPQMTHNQIFQVIRQNPDWFLNLLKKGAP
jgi:hypothetical protein